MSIRPINTKSEYKRALAFIESKFHAKRHSREGRAVEVLAILIEKYEDEHFPIDAPTPIEALKFRMEQLGMSNADLAKLIGTRARVSEIFNGKRRLSVKMMKIIHKELHVPADILLQG